MRYEDLRRQIEENFKLARRRGRLIRATENGKLSPGEAAAHDQKIAELTRMGSQFLAKLEKLKETDGFIVEKINREIAAAIYDHNISSGIQPTSLFQKIRTFIGTVSLVMLGTQMVDHWRHGSSRN